MAQVVEDLKVTWTMILNMAEAPFSVTENNVKSGFISLVSDNYVTVRDSEKKKFFIVELQSNNNLIELDLFAGSVIMNPSSKIIAVKGDQNSIEFFSVDTKDELKKSVEFPHPVTYWCWISSECVALVTATSVFHLNMDGTSPLKVFDRDPTLAEGVQIINYTVSGNGNWCLLCVSCAGGAYRVANGRMQLYNIDKKESYIYSGYNGCFIELKKANAKEATQFLCFEDKKLGHPPKLVIKRVDENVIVEIPTPSGDCSITLTCASKIGMVHMVSNTGHWYMFDVLTGKLVYHRPLDQVVCIQFAEHTATGNLLYMTTTGKVMQLCFNLVGDRSLVSHIFSSLHGVELVKSVVARLNVEEYIRVFEQGSSEHSLETLLVGVSTEKMNKLITQGYGNGILRRDGKLYGEEIILPGYGDFTYEVRGTSKQAANEDEYKNKCFEEKEMRFKEKEMYFNMYFQEREALLLLQEQILKNKLATYSTGEETRLITDIDSYKDDGLWEKATLLDLDVIVPKTEYDFIVAASDNDKQGQGFLELAKATNLQGLSRDKSKEGVREIFNKRFILKTPRLSPQEDQLVASSEKASNYREVGLWTFMDTHASHWQRTNQDCLMILKSRAPSFASIGLVIELTGQVGEFPDKDNVVKLRRNMYRIFRKRGFCGYMWGLLFNLHKAIVVRMSPATGIRDPCYYRLEVSREISGPLALQRMWKKLVNLTPFDLGIEDSMFETYRLQPIFTDDAPTECNINYLLGQGRQAIAYAVLMVGECDPKKYSIKMYKSQEDAKRFHHEVEVLTKLSEQNVENVIQIKWKNDEKVALVVSPVGKRLHSNDLRLNTEEAFAVGVILVETLRVVHTQCHLVHRDINPNNIFILSRASVNDPIKLVIGDWAMAVDVDAYVPYAGATTCAANAVLDHLTALHKTITLYQSNKVGKAHHQIDNKFAFQLWMDLESVVKTVWLAKVNPSLQSKLDAANIHPVKEVRYAKLKQVWEELKATNKTLRYWLEAARKEDYDELLEFWNLSFD